VNLTFHTQRLHRFLLDFQIDPNIHSPRTGSLKDPILVPLAPQGLVTIHPSTYVHLTEGRSRGWVTVSFGEPPNGTTTTITFGIIQVYMRKHYKGLQMPPFFDHAALHVNLPSCSPFHQRHAICRQITNKPSTDKVSRNIISKTSLSSQGWSLAGVTDGTA
jgi:hypothetical protein